MLKISHLLSRQIFARVCSFLAEPRPAGGRSARAGKIFTHGLILSKRVRCQLTKFKSYSLAKSRRSRPARKRQGHQKARKRRPGARNTATKNITGSPAAFDHGPEATAARIPRAPGPAEKPEAHALTSILSIKATKKQGPTEPNKVRTRQKTTENPKKPRIFNVAQ